MLAYYDPKLPTSLQTDASRLNGLGFVLLQKQLDGSWRMVQAGSRFLSDTETRYAMIELEMLGVTWAINKCRLFLEGLDRFEVVTDHRPLVPILNRYTLIEIENPRLQRLRMKVMNYKFNTTWRSGKQHVVPDALSRAPVNEPQPHDELAEQEVEDYVRAIIDQAREPDFPEDAHLAQVRQAAETDATYQDLIAVIHNGFPADKSDLPHDLKPYWSIRDKLSVDDTGLILCGCRLLIPTALRRTMLQRLHESHQGMERTKRRARLAIYWPRIDADIEKMVRACRECVADLPSQPKETLQPHTTPIRVFEHMASDIFTHGGRQFLVITDIKSGWPTTYNVGRTCRDNDLIDAFRTTFMNTAVPTVLYSDNGPQYTSRRFNDFLTQWGVQHVTSSPHYPQSNGHAEASVKCMKKLVRRCWNPRTGDVDNDKWAKGLLQWRNTPRDDQLSPAQVLYGHPVRDTLPVHKRAFAPEWQRAIREADARRDLQNEQKTTHYDSTAHDLPPLDNHTPVVIQNHVTKKWDAYGTVIEVGRNRDYLVRLPSGRVWRRNRRFLRECAAAADPGERNQPAPPAPRRLRHWAPLPEPRHEPAAARPPPAQPDVEPPPNVPRRRSAREPRPPNRLIEQI